MGFFDRLANVWKGFLSLWISSRTNPEAVYEAAIDERIEHREPRRPSAGSGTCGTSCRSRAEGARAQGSERPDPVAVEEGEDEAAMVLIQKKDEPHRADRPDPHELEGQRASRGGEDGPGVLGQIEVKREKAEMMAKKANAEARIQIQETLDGPAPTPTSRR